MSYLRDNKLWEEEDNLNWDVIEISKVDDKIIKRLIDNLKLETSDLSENFFISFESLLKLGNKIEPVIDSFIEETTEIHNCKVDTFNFILDFVKNNTLKYVLVPQLYHPDFITRARTVLKLEQAGDTSYLNFILPLLNDPDDSVRWSVIRFLNNHNHLLKNPLVYKEIKCYIGKELNPVIREKMKELFKKV
ncbi:MAG: HEAT repeat domain-containing protein [Candidatus Lokiarchaeota archaeon]|nr:HEAT repeat domain-containing protein [Candidatus Lokiarchaeota archaeon]